MCTLTRIWRPLLRGDNTTAFLQVALKIFKESGNMVVFPWVANNSSCKVSVSSQRSGKGTSKWWSSLRWISPFIFCRNLLSSCDNTLLFLSPSEKSHLHIMETVKGLMTFLWWTCWVKHHSGVYSRTISLVVIQKHSEWIILSLLHFRCLRVRRRSSPA